MKLKELLKKVTVQGDIRISVWEDDEEVNILEFCLEDRLEAAGVKDLQNMEITYLFAGSDGMLHIELKPHDEN